MNPTLLLEMMRLLACGMIVLTFYLPTIIAIPLMAEAMADNPEEEESDEYIT